MAALVAAIHVFEAANKDVDGRHRVGHDDEEGPVDVIEVYRTLVAPRRP
jgi:hypothetical protein